MKGKKLLWCVQTHSNSFQWDCMWFWSPHQVSIDPLYNPDSHTVRKRIMILKIYYKSIKKVQCNPSEANNKRESNKNNRTTWSKHLKPFKRPLPILLSSLRSGSTFPTLILCCRGHRRRWGCLVTRGSWRWGNGIFDVRTNRSRERRWWHGLRRSSSSESVWRRGSGDELHHWGVVDELKLLPSCLSGDERGDVGGRTGALSSWNFRNASCMYIIRNNLSIP